MISSPRFMLACDIYRRTSMGKTAFMLNMALARQYEALGFVRAEDLTADQRANLLSNPRPIEVQQDITIKQVPSKSP